MLIVDQPANPPSTPSVMLVQTDAAKSVITSPHILGICNLVQMEDDGSSVSGATILPITYANAYLEQSHIDARISTDPSDQKVTVRVVQAPKHGKLMVMDSDVEWAQYAGGRLDDGTYFPDTDYLGNDSMVLVVEGGGQTVELHYFFRMDGKRDGGSILDNKNCKSYSWIISSIQPKMIDAQNGDLLSNASLGGYLLKQVNVSLNIANLSDGKLAETTGHNITLDDDGGGYGWFVDSTPGDNSEFLPTSNPNEWVAKPGSDAAGKMDMLTVLLHEYG
ncbi:MAG TPA: hypothetical protein VG962_05970, partial [Steroidobacteraceae bacterium]|nr:hypothetical protein [Steroidobacteraceae bacterium]